MLQTGSFCVRQALVPADFQSVAQLHRRTFYPRASPLFAAFIEWDRAMGLAMAGSVGGKGARSSCLLTEKAGGGVVATATLEASADRFRRPGLSTGETGRGLSLCYVSNVSVDSEHRRRGLATQLLEQAEKTALTWGCRSMLLHVDRAEKGGLSLYKRAGYRTVGLEPPWMPLVQLRPSVRLLLMAKRVKGTRRREA